MSRLSTDWGTRNSTVPTADHPTDFANAMRESYLNAGETGGRIETLTTT
jgi:hypothetical protein